MVGGWCVGWERGRWVAEEGVGAGGGGGRVV